VIDREILDFHTRKKIYNITLRERINNIKEFILRENIESQIEGVA